MRRDGFTLIEAMIVLAIVGIAGALLFGAMFSRGCGCGNLSGASAEKAHDEAVKWARDMGYKNAHASCVSADTDGDGYVSCTIREEGHEPQLIECAAAYNMNDGCKLPKLKAVGTN